MNEKLNTTTEHQYIDTIESLSNFYNENKEISWMAFDTEFVGENRYRTLLCLIQVATVNGIYLIDVLKVEDISLFLGFITDPKVEIISHAGENDYKILYNNYKIIPTNIFDTQLACGFIGLGYPTSFFKVLVQELQVKLTKSQVVTDWEKRPLSTEQLHYAIDDVLYLKTLRDKIIEKLEGSQKKEWMYKEFEVWESRDYYQTNPYFHFLKGNQSQSYNQHQKILLYRLINWREEKAAELDKSRDKVLPKATISLILKQSKTKTFTFENNRILERSSIKKFIPELKKIIDQPHTEFEINYVHTKKTKVFKSALTENADTILINLAKRKSMIEGIAPALVLNKTYLNQLRKNKDKPNWRKTFLGETMIAWLVDSPQLDVNISDNKIILSKK